MRLVSRLVLVLRPARRVSHLSPVIHSVSVASHPADFVHSDPLAALNVSNVDIHNHPELRRKIYSSLQEGDEGELSIAIPKEVSLRQSGQRTVTGIISEGAWLSSLRSSRPDRSSRVAATPEPQTPGQQGHHALPVPEFTPIQVKIFYSLKNPADGIQFVQPSESYQTVSVPYIVWKLVTPDVSVASASRLHHPLLSGCRAMLGTLC